MSPAAPPILALLLGLAPASSPSLPPPALATDHLHEVRPHPPPGALEAGLVIPGKIGALYAGAMAAIQAGRSRDALPLCRQARALAYRDYQEGPSPRLLAYRNFVRLGYMEEQLLEFTELERQLNRIQDRPLSEDKMLFLHERALLLHNQFLALRAATGQADERVLRQLLTTYEAVKDRPSPLKTTVLIGYAAILGEMGDRRGAQAAFSRISQEEQGAERLDLQVAYYYLALGDRQRAMSRLLSAARRDSWDHPSATQDGRTLRGMVYRMNDFDRLRDHPRFIELVTEPEERSR